MPGQINRGCLLGDLIYKTVCQSDVKIIVEIGTWNGLGSTRCIIDGLKEKKFFRFISIESSPKMHQEALKNVKPLSGVELWFGRIINPEDIPKMELNEIQKGWLIEDLNNYGIAPNVLDKIPPEIDLLVLDGGEFTSELEFNLIGSRTNYIFLDDTNPDTGSIKFLNIRKKILNGETCFNLIQEDLNDRNGWLFAKRVINCR